MRIPRIKARTSIQVIQVFQDKVCFWTSEPGFHCFVLAALRLCGPSVRVSTVPCVGIILLRVC